MRYGKRITVLLGLAVLALLPGFASLPVKGRGSVKAEGIGNPFEIRTQLREYTAYNPDTGIGAYGRYTELTAEEDAPETLKEVLEACNRRAEESVRLRADRAVWGEDGNAADTGRGTLTLGYIAAVTRADAALFSLLETEYEKGPSQADSDIICHFSGASYDTASGEEIALSDLAGSEDACSAMLEDALAVRYGVNYPAPKGYWA